jgi:hypothetical protein
MQGLICNKKIHELEQKKYKFTRTKMMFKLKIYLIIGHLKIVGMYSLNQDLLSKATKSKQKSYTFIYYIANFQNENKLCYRMK